MGLDRPTAENTKPYSYQDGIECTNSPLTRGVIPPGASIFLTPAISEPYSPAMKTTRILNLEHSEADSQRIRTALEKSFELAWRRVANEEEFNACLGAGEWDLIISSYSLPDYSGIEAFEAVLDSGLDIPFIIVSGSIDQETAVSAMRIGVSDFLMKDDLVRLVPAVTRELIEAQNRREMRVAEKALAESEDRLRLALSAAARTGCGLR
jgi:DNA-binding NtrC family response regulator